MSGLIVKDNALIQASYTLSLAEQRLLLLAIIEVRKASSGIEPNTLINIKASEYAKRFDINISTSYKVLNDASISLRKKDVSYQRKSPISGEMIKTFKPWVIECGYEPKYGYVFISFSDAVLPLITRLASHFTSYTIEKVANLKSGYAIRLYELIIQWRDKGMTQKYSIDELRSKLGVEPEQYQKMSNFKARVIDLAIEQINEHTDIMVKYKQYKIGKNITDISFSFKQKKIIEHIVPTNINAFIKLSNAQINMFSSKLAVLKELGSSAPVGASIEDYAKIIADDLRNASQQQKYHKYLSKVGYQRSKA